MGSAFFLTRLRVPHGFLIFGGGMMMVIGEVSGIQRRWRDVGSPRPTRSLTKREQHLWLGRLDANLIDQHGIDGGRTGRVIRVPIPRRPRCYGMEEDIRRSKEAGFLAHLTKPVDIKALERMLGETLGGLSS